MFPIFFLFQRTFRCLLLQRQCHFDMLKLLCKYHGSEYKEELSNEVWEFIMPGKTDPLDYFPSLVE